MSEDQFEKGMAIRKSVLGEEYVARAEANKTDFDADFVHYATENAWGAVWTRPGLEKKTRHLLTLAIYWLLSDGRKSWRCISARPRIQVSPAMR